MLCWHCVLALIALTWLPACIEGQTGQQLTFKGTSYANNTSLFITDLGDVDNNNVLCMTDLTDCCTGVGQWIYQDGFMNALVRNNRSGDDIFRTRGDMVVRLERRNNPIGPTGQYCCQVPTMANPNTDSTMCVILMYVSISGSGNQLVGQTYTLTCQVNAGGETVTPEYQWIKDDTEITDETSTILSFPSLADTDFGVYTCRVTVGDQTSTSTSVTIGVDVTLGSSGDAQVAGEDYTLTCQFTGGEAAVTPVYRWLKGGSSLAGETSDTLSFSPLRETDSGGYTCEVTTGSLTGTSPSVTITVVAPALSVDITANGQPNEGQSYSLTCDVNGDESLAVTSRTFQWDRVGGSGSVSQSSVLTFNTLSRDDDGEYMCTSTFTSPYLTNTQTVTATTMVTINRLRPGPVTGLQVTTRTDTTLHITWTVSPDIHIDRFEVTYSYTVKRCSAPPGAQHTDTITAGSTRSHTLTGLNEDSNYSITVRAINNKGSTMATVSADTMTSEPSGSPGSVTFGTVTLTSITVVWEEVPCSDRNGEITGYTVEYSSTTPPTTNTMSGSSSRELVVGGLLPRTSYAFTVRAEGGPRSTSATRFTSTPTDRGFFLDGTFLSNNSIVLLSDIGEGSNALFCLTDRTQCCTTEAGDARGRWRFPNDSTITLDDADLDFYAIRGYSSIRLNRRSDAVAPTGIYICRLPDEATGSGDNLHIGVYDDASEGSLTASLSYNPTSHTLTCVSSGGPVNTVTWTRNGADISSSPYQLRQSLEDRTTSTYHNLLNITSGDIEDYIGSFNCTVSNSRGSSPPQSVDINGILISGNERMHQISAPVAITCSSDLAVQTIQWLNNSDNGQELISNSGQQQLLLPIESVTLNLDNTMYTCEVQVMLATGVRTVQETITIQVDGELAPRLPTSIRNISITSSSATIQWMLTDPYIPSRPETFSVLYGISSEDLNSNSMQTMANSMNQTYSTPLTSLQIGTLYYYKIRSRNEFDMRETEVLSFTTNDEMSSAVTNLVADSMGNDDTLVISWRPPATPNGAITSYSISIINLKDGSAVRQEIIDLVETLSVTQTDLEPGVPYNVSIAAVNRAGPGEFSVSIYFTRQLAPSTAPMDVNVDRTSPTVMVVSWTPLSYVEARGFISHYTVAYSPQTSDGRKRQATGLTIDVPGMDSSTVTINDLDPETGYSVLVSGTTQGGLVGEMSVPVTNPAPESTSGNSAVVGIAIGIVLALLLVVTLVIIVAILILFRRRGGKFSPGKAGAIRLSNRVVMKPASPTSTKIAEAENGQMDEQFYENTVFMVKDRLKAVPVDKFGEHVQRMHADRDRWFETEYNAIEKSPQSDHNVAEHPQNKARNRFGNIFPYDHNRVVLKTLPGQEYSDYINASHVDGYHRDHMYIASQGPTENSVEDFWRMIWENRVPTIVMLTRIFEGRKKCEAYWPENADEAFVPVSGSPLTIKYKSMLPFAEFVIRKMIVAHSEESDTPPLEVTLFHYLAWPDHGVPTNAISLVNFIKRVRKTHPYNKQDTLLVHCSAGVGRTGTFITLDSMLERIKAENTINIYEFVSNLRKQRVLMVQTVTQYVFIHNALDELITCGDTEIAAANMRIVMGKLDRISPSTKVSGFQNHYQILEKVTSDIRSVDTSNATSEANTPKNRYQDKIPYNHCRVRLRPSAAQGSDYINASFIDGYRQKGAYIATQGPLQNTVNDFWRMIWEHEVKCIIMLCKTEEKQKEVCRNYWPRGRGNNENYGKYTVTLTSQEVCGDYAIRKMQVLESQARMSVSQSAVTVTQFHYVKWPEDGVPQSTTGVLEVANLVQKVQMGSGNKPIVVMCNDGVGRTGAFISTHAEMERMKAETVVDLFQFIKAARTQRKGLVSNKDQYEFCHRVLADFLDGFDTYANFKEII